MQRWMTCPQWVVRVPGVLAPGEDEVEHAPGGEDAVDGAEALEGIQSGILQGCPHLGVRGGVLRDRGAHPRSRHATKLNLNDLGLGNAFAMTPGGPSLLGQRERWPNLNKEKVNMQPLQSLLRH